MTISSPAVGCRGPGVVPPRLRVEIDSGPAYTIGPIEVRGLARYDRQLVERYSTLVPGEPYDADKLLEFQRLLQRTPYFGTVIVDVDPARATGHELPVLVQVREAQTKRASFALGYSTDIGVRGQAAYRQATLFGYPYSLQSGVDLDRTRQAAYADAGPRTTPDAADPSRRQPDTPVDVCPHRPRSQPEHTSTARRRRARGADYHGASPRPHGRRRHLAGVVQWQNISFPS